MVIFLVTPREHIKHTRPVRSLPKEAGVTLKVKNCTFSQERLIILATLFVCVDWKSPVTAPIVYATWKC